MALSYKHPWNFLDLYKAVQGVHPTCIQERSRPLVADALCKLLSKPLADVQQVNGLGQALTLHCAAKADSMLALQRHVPAEVLQLVLGQLSNKDLGRIGLTCKGLYHNSIGRDLARLMEYVHGVIDFLLKRMYQCAEQISYHRDQAAWGTALLKRYRGIEKPSTAAESKETLQSSYQRLAEAEQRGTKIRVSRLLFNRDLFMVDWYLRVCQGAQEKLFLD